MKPLALALAYLSLALALSCTQADEGEAPGPDGPRAGDEMDVVANDGAWHGAGTQQAAKALAANPNPAELAALLERGTVMGSRERAQCTVIDGGLHGLPRVRIDSGELDRMTLWVPARFLAERAVAEEVDWNAIPSGTISDRPAKKPTRSGTLNGRDRTTGALHVPRINVWKSPTTGWSGGLAGTLPHGTHVTVHRDKATPNGTVFLVSAWDVEGWVPESLIDIN